MATRPWPAPPVTLNAIAAGWRVALAAAHDALAAGSDWLPPDDVRVRSAGLNREREQVAALLDADARMEHMRLVHRLALPTATRRDLGLPPTVDACIFDLDGVLTPSDELHFTAWAVALDTFLLGRLDRAGPQFAHYARFRRADYDELIAGKPRLDGVRAFLASRGITLPEGTPADPADAETVQGLANHKNAALHRLLERQGVDAYEGSHRYLEAAADAGVALIVVSPSANTGAILEHAGLGELVDFRVDGETMNGQDLQPSPAPDLLLAACSLLSLPPVRAAAFETTDAGVTAARTAGIGFVVGVDRSDDPHHGLAADALVGDLGEMLHGQLGR